MRAHATAKDDPVIGRYSKSDELAIEATSSALGLLARALRNAPSSVELVIPPEQDAGPYDGFLVEVVVEPTTGKLRIARRGGTLLISGGDESRAVLAKNIESLAEGTLGDHIHVEYHPDHYYLDPSTASLVVERIHARGQ